jgi:CBS-domain-containing membrane protein
MPLNAAGVMTRDVVTARPDNSVARVAKLLSDHEIIVVAVCDDQAGCSAC